MIVLTQRFIIALLLGTIGLMTWYELGMEQHLVIDHETDLTVVVNDDREVRGRSIGRLFRDDDALVMTCQIRRGFRLAFLPNQRYARLSTLRRRSLTLRHGTA